MQYIYEEISRKKQKRKKAFCICIDFQDPDRVYLFADTEKKNFSFSSEKKKIF